MVHNGTSSSYRLVDCIGLWSCLVFLLLCLPSTSVSLVFMVLYIFKTILLHSLLCLLVSWARCDWPLTQLINHCPSVLSHCWLGRLRLVWPIKSYPKWPMMCGVGLNAIVLLFTRAFRFAIWVKSFWANRFVLLKKSAIRFGCCIRLINDHTPIVPYSAVVFYSRHEVVRVTHDDGAELTFDNIVNDSSLYAYTAVMCWIESIRFRKLNRNIFFWI